MLSRVAESVYWMSRYLERVENVARFVDVNHDLTLDRDETAVEQWSPLIYTTGDEQLFEQTYDVPCSAATRSQVLEFLTFKKSNPSSIYSSLSKARENARSVRGIISTSMWEEVNKFYLFVRDASAERDVLLRRPFEFYNQIKLACHTLAGLTDATMGHDEAWNFGRMGCLLERAEKTSRVLDVKYYMLLPKTQDVGTPLDVLQWTALLKSTSAFVVYRRFHGRISPAKVAEFLIFSREFPRSIRFCLSGAEDSLRSITGSQQGCFEGSAERLLGRLRSELDFTEVDDVIGRGMHEFIDDLQHKLNRVGRAIEETFFRVESVDLAELLHANVATQ